MARRDRIAGDGLLGGDLARVHEQQRAVDHPERDPRLVRGPADHGVGALEQARGLERDHDLAQLAVAAAEVAGEAVVALGEPAELVVAGQLEAARVLAGGHLVDGPGDGPERRAEVGREQGGQQDGEHDRHRDREQQHARDGRVGLGHPRHEQEHDAERRRPGGRRRRSGRASAASGTRTRSRDRPAEGRRAPRRPGLGRVDRGQLGRVARSVRGAPRRARSGRTGAAVREASRSGRRRDQVHSRTRAAAASSTRAGPLLVRREVGVAHRGAWLAPTSR